MTEYTKLTDILDYIKKTERPNIDNIINTFNRLCESYNFNNDREIYK